MFSRCFRHPVERVPYATYSRLRSPLFRSAKTHAPATRVFSSAHSSFVIVMFFSASPPPIIRAPGEILRRASRSLFYYYFSSSFYYPVSSFHCYHNNRQRSRKRDARCACKRCSPREAVRSTDNVFCFHGLLDTRARFRALIGRAHFETRQELLVPKNFRFYSKTNKRLFKGSDDLCSFAGDGKTFRVRYNKSVFRPNFKCGFENFRPRLSICFIVIAGPDLGGRSRGCLPCFSKILLKTLTESRIVHW